jgi:hypothetical protein
LIWASGVIGEDEAAIVLVASGRAPVLSAAVGRPRAKARREREWVMEELRVLGGAAEPHWLGALA